MIYLVSGFMRCGTSMMMKALHEGGLDVSHDPDRAKLNARFGDEYYQPNAGGFWELARDDYRDPHFPQKFDGKLIKLLMGGLNRMAVMQYRIVFMWRSPKEIAASYEAFFGHPLQRAGKIEEQKNRLLELTHNRRDVVSLHEFSYPDVVSAPKQHFVKLKREGWPIDVEKAAAVVDAKQRRFKESEL